MDAVKFRNDKLVLLDQTKLPVNVVFIECKSYRCVAESIKNMKVRGAPAIGVAAAYGLVLAALEYRTLAPGDFMVRVREAARTLSLTRPTAVNLFWALNRMLSVFVDDADSDVEQLVAKLRAEAGRIQKEDLDMNIKMAQAGCNLIPPRANILTHCNAGALATAGYGTALGIIREAHKEGKLQMVYADETRPLLQGARLTAFELMEDGIPTTLIADNMAAYLMQQKKIDCIIVGADRIAGNGDVANKIGTYGVAVLAKYHNIPFYVAAPASTFDLSLSTGKDIPIEERNPEEIRKIGGVSIAPPEVRVVNPAFDITPHDLITAIVTDKGILKPEYSTQIKRMFLNG
ncbi:MAG: S-methyl-5-thioribose-1-phosphate isomerase [Peptococcaceae bacterium]